MNCLVVGASGYLGSRLVTALESQGHQVMRVGGPFSLRGVSGYAWAEGLYTAIQQELAPIDLVVYAAGRVVPSTSVTINEALRLDAMPLGELLASLSVLKRRPVFVLLSTAGAVYGPARAGEVLTESTPLAPLSVYGLVRTIMEQMLTWACQTRQVRGVVLRLSNVYGPAQRLNGPSAFIARAVEAAATGTPMELWGNGEQRKDFLFVDELPTAVSRAVEYAQSPAYEGGPTTFNVCRGSSDSLRDVMATIERIAGKPVPYRTVEAHSSDVSRVELSSERATKVLNWSSAFSLEQGLSQVWRGRQGA